MWLWKNWEILALSTKAKESGGVGLRSRAASEHLLDAKNQGEGKEKQAGDTWGPLTKQAQSLIANEFTHVNSYLEWVLTKERSGTRIEGPTEWDFLAWLFHFFQCRSVSYNFSNPPQSLAWKMWVTLDREVKMVHKIMPGWCCLHPHGRQFQESQGFPFCDF